MRNSRQSTRLALLVAVVAVLVVGVLYLRADTAPPSGHCPLCHTKGTPVPARDELSKCECEEWWNGQAPARLMFADCSSRKCAEYGPAWQPMTGEEPLSYPFPTVYVDLQLYVCPRDGLLFGDPR